MSDLILEGKPITNLIVLSACETGRGKMNQGEGVFSFNHAFAAMGIPACITNLWSIDNVSTYQLTELFYKYLAKGLPAAQALQKAKIDFIRKSTKQRTIPYYWAATILTGKSEVLSESGFGKIWISVPAIVLLLIIAMYVYNKRFILNRKPDELN
jgi:CHAT domain-containing protein